MVDGIVKQEGGEVPLMPEQVEATSLRSGEQLLTKRESLSRILMQLVEQYGLEFVRQEFIEVERKIGFIERETLTRDEAFFLFTGFERDIEKPRNG